MLWLTIKEKELIEKDEEIKRQIAANKEMNKIIGEKDKALAIYKQALELACEEFENFIYIKDQEWLTKPECLLKKAKQKLEKGGEE